MRFLLVGLLTLVAMGPARWVAAQPLLGVATIARPEVEVRAGPSERYPVVGRLRQGETVHIRGEEGAWVAIAPPRGAISWVNHRFLGEFDPNHKGRQNAVIMANRVEVRLGTTLAAGPLPVKQAELALGTIVEIVGPKAIHENSVWYPIASPSQEVRYVPRSALGGIRLGNGVAHGAASSAASATSAISAASPNGTTASTVADPWNDPQTRSSARAWLNRHPLWQRSEQAEQAGNLLLAEGCLQDLVKELRQSNSEPALVLECLNRMNALRERIHRDYPNGFASNAPYRPSAFTNGGTSNGMSVGMNSDTSGNVYGSPYGNSYGGNPPPAPNGYSTTPVARGTNAANGYPPASTVSRSKPQPPPAPALPTPPGMTVAQLHSVGPGILHRLGTPIDGRTVYAVEGGMGQGIVYVFPSQSVNLELWVNRRVEVIGSMSYRGDLRAYTMTAVRVNAVP